MDRYLLKRIIIIILLLVNVFLLGSLATRITAERQAQQQAREQLVALFAANSITLDPSAVSRKAPPDALTLARSSQREASAAAFFLGEHLTYEDHGGGTCTYSNDAGLVRFRSNGSFDVVGSISGENGRKLCESFCKKFGFDAPVFSLDETGTGTASARASHSRLPVINCSVTFTLEEGVLTRLSGTLLPVESTVTTGDRQLLTAPAALTAFQNMRRETFAVVSAVTEMYPCYELQSTSAAALSLVPVWCIVTDINQYYVNCLTGTVTSG